MTHYCETSMSLSLLQVLPDRLKNHAYSIVELAQLMAQEFECPLCEVMTPLGEALFELTEQQAISYDHNRLTLV